MKVISFFTKNTIYEKEVEDLAASCQALNLDHYIEERKDLGSWEKNCAQKPLFIYECFEKFHTPLLWVDADAIILQKPNLHLGPCDFGLYFNTLNPKHVRSATIFVNPTQRAIKFLWKWHEILVKINRTSLSQDQPILNTLINQEILDIAHLPIEYMQIFDRDPNPPEQAVVLHFQASRTARMDPAFWRHLSGKELKLMRIKISESGNVII